MQKLTSARDDTGLDSDKRLGFGKQWLDVPGGGVGASNTQRMLANSRDCDDDGSGCLAAACDRPAV